MNDRFRFRVWDKRRNKFIESPEPTPMLQANGLLAYFKDAEYMNNYVIQFCTGLKDKNGKLIYEGDIVRFIYGNKKRLGYVEENKTVWSITNSNFCQGAWCSGALIQLYETCEIIGNIYENKELLEDAECQK